MPGIRRITRARVAHAKPRILRRSRLDVPAARQASVRQPAQAEHRGAALRLHAGVDTQAGHVQQLAAAIDQRSAALPCRQARSTGIASSGCAARTGCCAGTARRHGARATRSDASRCGSRPPLGHGGHLEAAVPCGHVNAPCPAQVEVQRRIRLDLHCRLAHHVQKAGMQAQQAARDRPGCAGRRIRQFLQQPLHQRFRHAGIAL